MDHFIVHTDGGARGNPGPAAVGVVIANGKGRVLAKLSRRIGEATNNVAEYSAVVEALLWIKENFPKGTSSYEARISFFLDSNLVVNQLNGFFKVKEPTLRDFLVRIRTLEQEIATPITYAFVPREKNTEADTLVNEALDTPAYVQKNH